MSNNEDQEVQEGSQTQENTEGAVSEVGADAPATAGAEGDAPSEGEARSGTGAAPAGTVSEEELDRIADAAIETLRGILTYFDAEESAIDEYEGDEGELILDIVGDNLAVLIGHYGKTLDALQFIVSAVVSKSIGYRYPIVVDVGGYRTRRRQKLEGIAKSSAARCVRSEEPVSLKAMTPYERRIVHIVLRDDTRVVTESEGEEPNRYIVIKPA